MGDNGVGISSKKCAVCGKVFYRADFSEYIYKIGGKWFCSYTCYRVIQKQKEAEEEKKNERKSIRVLLE